jgi:hypothetical protein
MGVMRNVYRTLYERPDKRKPLRRPRHGWKDNIKMMSKNRDGRCRLDSFGSGPETGRRHFCTQ